MLSSTQFKENPDAWLLVDKILQDAQYPQTKCKLAKVVAWVVATLTMSRLGAPGSRQCDHDEVEGASSRSMSR
jgi:hypothetical protein